MKSRIATLVAGAIAAGVLPAGQVDAAVLYSSSFNPPTYTSGALVSQDGWNQTGTTATNPVQVNVAGSNGSVVLGPTGQDVNHGLSTSITSGSVYYGADINLSAVQTGDYFLHFAASTTDTSTFVGRLFAQAATGGYVLGLTTGSGTPTYGTTVIPLNTTVRVIARYDLVPGTGNDTGALFVNPTGTTEGTPYAVATTVGTDATTIGSINFRQGGTSSSPSLTIDNLSVATTYAEVVPEPSSLVLLPAAGLLALRTRRRRTA